VRALFLSILVAIGTVPTPLAAAHEVHPLVFAAASLQESMNASADAWQRRGHLRPAISLAASSALARQIEAGAPADLFVSADEDWMNELQRKGLLRAGTRQSFLGNHLVLIAPSNSRLKLRISKGFALASALDSGRLAIADPNFVPAGKYGRAALINLRVWQSVQAKLAPAQDVRAALAYVERAEAPLGIVYETDALASKKVRIVARFPDGTYPPISYPIAMVKSSNNREADAFRNFLLSPAGKAIFRHFGFSTR